MEEIPARDQELEDFIVFVFSDKKNKKNPSQGGFCKL